MSTFNIQVTPQNNTLLVIDNDQNQVVVTNPITSIVEVNSLGPQGPQGPPGPSFPYNGVAIISGSLVVTGSIIATQGFTGSLLGTASYALNAINSEGGSVFQYLTVDDQLNNWAGDIIDGVYGTMNVTGSLLTSASYSNKFQLFEIIRTSRLLSVLDQTGTNITSSLNINDGTELYAGTYFSAPSGSYFTGLTFNIYNPNQQIKLYHTSSQPAIQQDSYFTTSSLRLEKNLVVIEGITGSLFGTSSYALTASYALNAGNSQEGNVFQYSTVDDQLNDWAGDIINGVYGTVNVTGSLLNSASYSNKFQLFEIIQTSRLLSVLDQTGTNITSSLNINDSTELYAGTYFSAPSGSYFTGLTFNIYNPNQEVKLYYTSSQPQFQQNSYFVTSSLRLEKNLVVVEGITGSLFGTASYALNSLTTSTGSLVTTSSFNAFTASYRQDSASFDTRINIISSSYATKGSNTFVGNQTIQGNILVRGTASVDVLITNYESSSIIYSSGSTKFGDTLDDTHQYTGSLFITGSTVSLQGGSFSGSGANLFNIPASGITGLNLSQIATGSISASVSLGTGSFAVNSGSSNLLFVSSSGNIGIGTTTPANKLDISGSARVNGAITFATDGSGGNGLSFTRNSSNNWTWGTAGIGNVMLIQGNTITLPQPTTTNNGLFVTPGANSTTQGLVITSGSYPAATLLRVGVNSLVVTGSNVGIGTLTPIFPLDVSGSGRFSGNVQITGSASNSLLVKGSGTTSSTTSLLVQNSAGNATLTAKDDQSVFIGNQVAGTGNNVLDQSSQRLYLGANGQVGSYISATINGGTGDTSLALFGLGTGGGYFGGIRFFTSANSTTPVLAMIVDRNQNIGIGLTNSTNLTTNTSAKVQIDSTTQGFLPPRTNLASNIDAPAQGLQTYITASATEGLYYYNSGSYQGWTRVLNNSGSQSIAGDLTVTGSLIISTTGSFILPLSQSASPLTGSAYWSGSFLYIYDGTRYRSSSFA